jgi:transcriptional regulator with XRE-family HTH domain
MKTSSPKRKRHVVRWIRQQLGLRQWELSRLIGCSVETIQSIETNRMPLSERFAFRIAEETGFNPNLLLANTIPNSVPSKRKLKEDFEEAQSGRWLGIYKARLLPRMFFERAYLFYRLVCDSIGYSGLIEKGGRRLLLKFTSDLLAMVPDKRERRLISNSAKEISRDALDTLAFHRADLAELEYVIREQPPAAKTAARR